MANTKGVADHKAANTTTIPGLTVERTKSIVLLLVQLFSVVQTGLSIAGISQLPFTSDQVSTAITGVIAVIASGAKINTLSAGFLGFSVLGICLVLIF